jgi:hypothetical protein
MSGRVCIMCKDNYPMETFATWEPDLGLSAAILLQPPRQPHSQNFAADLNTPRAPIPIPYVLQQ